MKEIDSLQNIEYVLNQVNSQKNTTQQIMETLPENQKTREIFAKFGLDYDKWIKFNDEFYESFCC